MAIITFTSKSDKVKSYIPVVNGYYLCWYSTFEAAMLGAIGIKTHNVDAVKYAGKLLGVTMYD